MADHIRLDREKLADAQKRFTAMAGNVEQMQKDLKVAIEPLTQGAWKGAGFDSFVKEFVHEVVPARRALLQALQDGSTQLAEIEKIFRDAEDQAKQTGTASGR